MCFLLLEVCFDKKSVLSPLWVCCNRFDIKSIIMNIKRRAAWRICIIFSISLWGTLGLLACTVVGRQHPRRSGGAALEYPTYSHQPFPKILIEELLWERATSLILQTLTKDQGELKNIHFIQNSQFFYYQWKDNIKPVPGCDHNISCPSAQPKSSV